MNYGIKQYQNTDVNSKLSAASPYEITKLLYEAALKNIKLSISYQKSGELNKKSESVSKVQSIVVLLASTLKDDVSPELSENLRRLYDYINETMYEFMLEGDTEKADSAFECLLKIKQGWDEISQ